MGADGFPAIGSPIFGPGSDEARRYGWLGNASDVREGQTTSRTAATTKMIVTSSLTQYMRHISSARDGNINDPTPTPD